MAHKFNQLVKSGTNFEFVGRSKLFFTISIFLLLASLAMLPINKVTRGSILNWTIDFKGGTEIIFGFERTVDTGEVRTALSASGFGGVDVSTFAFSEDGKTHPGILVRLPEFGSLTKQEAKKTSAAFTKKFKDRGVTKVGWSGDTFFVRSEKAITEVELREFLKSAGQEMKPWNDEDNLLYGSPVAGLDEYNVQARVHGLDRKVQQALAGKLGTKVRIKQVEGVGAKAGSELIRDAVKSLFYAILFILLYIAFRFDFRFGPGTVAAMLHDAILVVGVFAVTWTDVSLTTMAALLTVIGYSMNDTIVIFDRIRENETRLKDKKLDRVINISINETMARTLLTSMTTFMVTLALNILGSGLVKNFAFAMNVGVIVGTYSSIFVASPLLLWMHNKYFAKRGTRSKRNRKRRDQAEPA